MSPIQQMLLGVGAVDTKTYVDDVFNTYLYKGTSVSNGGPAQTINNGIDVSGKGGLVWIKTRSAAYSNALFDTVRGKTKRIKTNSSDAEDTDTAYLADFKTNGFEVGTSASTNSSDQTFASWTFRKAPGFFDVVTYTGTGSTRTVDHNLGCIPGMILIKRLDTTDNWNVYHRSQHSSNSAGYYLQLNTADSIGGASNRWNDTAPTATQFTVGTAPVVNASGDDFVAYVFAGGEGTTDKAVDFDGSGDSLSVANSSDFSFGSGDFTIEGWFKIDQQSSQNGIINVWGYSANRRSWNIQTDNSSNGPLEFYVSNDGNGGGSLTSCNGGNVAVGQWYHFAAVRTGNTLKLFLNGKEVATSSFSGSIYNNTTDDLYIGSVFGQTDFTNGQISNIRITKGQAVYKTNFNVPHDPLTQTSQNAVSSNVKLLCCNGSTTTASSVTPGTITANGDPAVTTNNSIFDDTSANVFGDAGDQNVVKCGSYVGNGSSTGPEINLGFEPSWILMKNATASSRDWKIVDAMRGIVTNGDDASLRPNESNTEDDESVIDLTPTGFKITASNAHYNENGETIIYCAIRRPDGYVGKPPELGTGVFAMTTGTSNTPAYSSGFITDLTINRQPASAEDWYIQSRLTGTKYLVTNDTDVEANDSNGTWDYNNGWYGSSQGSNYQAWMWKRHAGFDVVAYKGDGVAGKQIPHSLSKTPEMIWIKNSDRGEAWRVYHKGLNGGTTPHNYGLKLNTNDAESAVTIWNQTAPTSTHFTINADSGVNHDGEDMRAFLFASVDGISKVGTYSGSSGDVTVTTGFQPRLVILKRFTGAAGTGDWFVYDTTRGFTGSGDDDKALKLNSSAAQTTMTIGTVTSTGFTITMQGSSHNSAGSTYLYYAHA